MAHQLGVQSPLEPVPSIGLGSNAVSPLDMASAYATLAAGGDLLAADGDPQGDPPERQGGRRGRLGQAAAPARDPRRRRLHRDEDPRAERALRHGHRARTSAGPTAGKTGTTDDHADAWFCGYLPNLEATVWVGYPQAEIPMENVHGIAVAGGSFPAEIWRLFMERAVRYTPPQDLRCRRTYPTWKPFERGDYAIQYVPPDTTTDDRRRPADDQGGDHRRDDDRAGDHDDPDVPVTTEEVHDGSRRRLRSRRPWRRRR